MSLLDVIAALTSALLHAAWNGGVKASARPVEAMAAQIILSAFLVLPCLIYTGLPPLAAWPWLAGSSLLSIMTVTALLRGYEHGGFGLVYPMSRAISVMLVVPLSTWLAGDMIRTPALVGVALIVTSLGMLAVSARNSKDFPPQAQLWIGVAGVTTALYVLCDAQGVRTAGSLSYGFAVSIVNAVVMGWRHRKLGSPLRLIRTNAAIAVPAACASVASYLLILWVWGHAPVAPASALRDTSAVFALLISIVLLGERFTPMRILAVLTAAAAVPLLRLA